MEEKVIFVVGSNILQNQLIASYLEEELGVACKALEDYDKALSSITSKGGIHVILYDCAGKDANNCLAGCRIDPGTDSIMLCLFNLDKDSAVEEKMLMRGVRGFFYNGDSLELFKKGLVAIINGEYWVSRRILSEIISKNNRPLRNLDPYGLSRRELEIVSLIAECASNEEIAERLCISRQTVKTHLYKIYRKINVQSRFQAALWAAHNL